MPRRFDSGFPFPLSDVSNGEWCPRPPTSRQKAAADLLAVEADRRAKKLGLSRRQFLRTAAGTATAYMVLNTVHGLDQTGDAAVLPVTEVQCDDPEAARELFEADYFVMDVQIHHVDTTRFNNPALGDILRFRDRGATPEENLELVGQMNMIKEVFVDSETEVGVISGVPDGQPLPVDTMAATRDLVNELAGSERCLSQAMIDPTRGPGTSISVDSLEHQVRNLGAAALKCYTGKHNWFLDDEAIAYPMLEEASRVGLRMVNVHKGLPQILGEMSTDYVRSRDIPRVSKDWPRLNFVVYHSGYFPGERLSEPDEAIGEFLDVMRTIPHRRNVYAEIGSAFALAWSRGPHVAAHMIGSLLRDVGENRMIWGTDSVWWGSPKWQIDALKTLEISPQMQETYGYPPLTERARRRIFGLNAARLYRVKVHEKRCAIAADHFSELRRDAERIQRNRSFRVYGPRTRRQFLNLMRREQRR